MKNVVYTLLLLVLGFNISFAQNDLKSNQKIKSIKIIHKDFEHYGEISKITKQELYTFNRKGDTLQNKIEDEYTIKENTNYYFNGLKYKCVKSLLLKQSNFKIKNVDFYDTKGHLIKDNLFDNNGINVKETINYSYYYTNYKTKVIELMEDGREKSQIYNYDSIGNLVKIENINEKGESWVKKPFKYDVKGNLIEKTGDFNKKTKYTYNNKNQLIKTVLEDLEYNYKYNTQGTLIEKREKSFISKEYGYNLIVYKYNSIGLIFKKVQYQNRALDSSTSYIYSGNKLTRINYYFGTQFHHFKNIKYTYDSFKNLINETKLLNNKVKVSSNERIIQYF